MKKRKYEDKSRTPPMYKNCTRVQYNCDYCNKPAWEKKSAYAIKKRHFCSTECYSKYRHYFMSKEEHNAYGTGHSLEERKVRTKCRSALNHAIRDGIIQKKPCVVCGDTKSEAHHVDYLKSLDVVWLCFKHHRMCHKNPELIEATS